MNTNKILIAAIAIVLILQIVSLFTGKDAVLGSATHFSGPIDSQEGFTVDDVERISGTGGLSVTTGSFSSTLSVTGATTLTGSIVANGSNFTTSTATIGTSTTASLCDGYNLWTITPLPENGTTLYFPSTTTLAADCLDAVGDMIGPINITISTSSAALKANTAVTITESYEGTYGNGLRIRTTTSTDPVVLYTNDTATFNCYRNTSATTTCVFEINR